MNNIIYDLNQDISNFYQNFKQIVYKGEAHYKSIYNNYVFVVSRQAEIVYDIRYNLIFPSKKQMNDFLNKHTFSIISEYGGQKCKDNTYINIQENTIQIFSNYSVIAIPLYNLYMHEYKTHLKIFRNDNIQYEYNSFSKQYLLEVSCKYILLNKKQKYKICDNIIVIDIFDNFNHNHNNTNRIYICHGMASIDESFKYEEFAQTIIIKKIIMYII